ncbi:MAG: type II methionyl aminopeptidase [Candidatus Odinarchaeia archaeon]
MSEQKEESKEEKQKEKSEQEEKFEKYREAGKIHSKVAKFIKPKIKVGASVIELCELIENKIKELGGKWAFPTNISINNIAAHYSSPPEDKTVINENDVVKIDYGVHVDGFIADSAFTISFNPEYDKLVEASEEATKNAIEAIKPKVKTNEIGEVIESTIKKFGFRPIRDLSGHNLGEYQLHGAKNIPNIKVPFGKEIEEGEVYAIETFATTGKGYAHETPPVYIFSLLPVRTPIRSKLARSVLGKIIKEYATLPFAQRWLLGDLTYGQLKLAFRELVNNGLLHTYHVLADIKGSYVSQSEHTVIVHKDGCEITTI